MQLTAQQQSWLDGDAGPARQWAMQFNHALGCFFDAERMVPVASAHFAPDTRMGGAAALRLLESMVEADARVVVPAYLDPCCVDFERATEFVASFGLTEEFVRSDRADPDLMPSPRFSADLYLY